MTESSDNLKDLYSAIKTISNYFEGGNNGQLTVNKKYADLIDKYCDYGDKSEKGNCNNEHFKIISSGVINLLDNLKKYKLEDDKLADYAILWLSYILNLYLKDKLTNLSEFYTNYIEKNKCYNEKINGDGSTYKEIIDKKKDLMDMNISEIFKLEAPFNILYYLYHQIYDQTSFCSEYSKYATKFSDQFKELNNDSNNIEDSSFSQILSTLLNDHNNLINKYCKESCSFSSISQLPPKKKPVEGSAKGGEQTSLPILEATPSSSSTLNTVIPILSTFAIPVFLGVAYKYSLFGFDKLFQRQYIRNKLKKIKNKMELNI
ncbi:CIR protein [Plasmodium chabaudi chabaudi]|uniref:CIR protein n=1 Tax=Plasmodium chabaudi chabaudi TaxID=31271 RepID=A0A4V0KBG6_PLACU|nr:CIR protein [Plasmodium chabaudi chabaudi]VTZ69960.1 CIR protein [Plasmodium chabaudi chabaudi]|eukprot:XP_016652902.1 CIR protein [Plasmodium chabaudi chabaudi]